MNIIKIINITIFTILISSIDCYAQKPRKIFSYLQENNLNLALEEYAKIKTNKAYDTDEKILFEIADCIFLINKSNTNYNPIQSINYYNNIYKNIDNYFNTPKSKKDIVEFLAKYDLTFDTIANRIHSEIAFEAKKINTVKSYDKALEVCSDKFRFELKQLKEEAFYKQTINESTIGAYKTFILNYSNSKHVSEIQVLLERRVLDNAKSNQSVDDLNTFIIEYATSNLKQEATDFRDSIVLSKVPNTYDAMLAFTKEFPYSKYLKGAKSKLPDLLYNESIELNTVESLKRFMSEFPNDLRVDDIYKKFKSILFSETSFTKLNNLDINCGVGFGEPRPLDKKHGVLIISSYNNKEGVKSGVVDKKGKLITPIKYFHIGDFHEGYAFVLYNGKYGFISIKGKEITPLEYDGAKDFHNGFARVKQNGKWFYIDTNGNEIIQNYFQKEYDDISYYYDWFNNNNLVAKVELTNNHGFIDKNGKVIIPIKYNYIGDFHEGLANVINLTEGIGFIDINGNEIIPMKYDYSESDKEFHNGLVSLCEKPGEGTCGVFDINGNEIIPMKYDRIYNFYDGHAIVELNEKSGVIDLKGNEIIPIKYDHISGFHEGISSVRLNEKSGLIDLKGNEIILMKKYFFIGDFHEGIARVEVLGEGIGYIDNKGNEIISLKYDYATDFHDGYAFVNIKGKGSAIIDKNGVEVIPLKYSFITDFNEGVAFAEDACEIIMIKLNQ